MPENNDSLPNKGNIDYFSFKKRMDNRNYLARLRTQMANERTLMSYYRGALALIGLGAFIFKFYDSIVFQVLSVVSAVTGIILAIYGIVRYRNYKAKLLKKSMGAKETY